MTEHAITRPTALPANLTPALLVQRKCACGAAPGMSGACDECRESQLQRKPATMNASGVAPRDVSAALRAPGRPLDHGMREFMESRFGHDFSQVQVHADGAAAASARSIDALAYTVGSDVVFAAGQYAPHQPAGRRLIAHELAHVVQQSGTRANARTHLQIGDANDTAEVEADRIAAQVTGGESVTASPQPAQSPAVVRRQPANSPRTETEDCEPALQNDLKALHQPALDHVDRAITSLAPGWKNMAPADKAAFTQYFDPAGSGDIDEGFVRDVRQKYRFIHANMRSLRFDCDPGSLTLCGTSKRWCTGGRLMWTCFGALHVCTAAYKTATPDFKIETIIHESVHNALLTTDRAYHNEPGFRKLRPRGGGFWGSVLNFLGKIPVLGILFRSLPGNNDTINNPDSYAGYAMQV